MYSFRKSKKGFTLIELMVVVAIIGILALLGLRLYTGQQVKAKEAIVKANAGTVQTLIQAELADGPLADYSALVTEINNDAGMQNPFTGAVCATTATDISGGAPGTTAKGVVYVYEETSGVTYFVRPYGDSNMLPDTLTAQH